MTEWRIGCRVLLLVAMTAGLVGQSNAAAASSSCAEAAKVAEQAANLPPGLLAAIGRVESGRRDPASGAIAGWPWSVNDAGTGFWFDSRDTATAYVRDRLATGQQVLDVGCFQIDLHYHPGAFASLEDAFDPGANAAEAARILNALFLHTADWKEAVALYHSADPVRGKSYRDAVMAAWAGSPWQSDVAGPTATETDPFVVWHAGPVVMAAIWTPAVAGAVPLRSWRHLPRVITP